MASRITTSLGLREGEGARTARLFVFIFLLTAAAVLARSAQREIFLAAYPRSAIPDAFLLSAAVLCLASLGISALAGRLAQVRLTQVLVATCALLLFAAHFARGFLADSAPMAVYVVVEVAVSVLLTQGWGVASEAVDVRSAKRLLPLVGFGAGLAWTGGGLAIGGLAKRVGPEALLLLAPVALVGAVGVLAVLARNDIAESKRQERSEGFLKDTADGLRYIATEPLMRVLAAVVTLELVVEKVTDLQLLATAQARFAGETGGVAAFMGLFYGVTGGVTLLAPAVTGRLLARFGSTRAIVTAQAWVLAASVLFLLFPLFPVVVLLTGGDRVLKQALGAPARSQIFGAVPAMRRVQAGALLRGVVAAVFSALAAVGLKALPPGLPVHWLSFGTVAVMVPLLLLSRRWLNRGYLEALQRSVDQSRIDLDSGQHVRELDREQVATLADELASRDDSRAVLAVSVLASSKLAVARPLLVRALAHPSAEVRALAVQALGRGGDPADAESVARVLAGSTEEEVRCACLRALTDLGGPGALARLEACSDDASPRVRALARAGRASLFQVGVGSGRGAGAELVAFEAMLASKVPEEREAAAWAVGEVPLRASGLRAGFTPLLEDASLPVRRAAVGASGGFADAGIVRALVFALDEPATSSAAFDAFAKLNDAGVGQVENVLRDAPPAVVSRTASALSRGTGLRATELLKGLLGHADSQVRYRASRALVVRRRQDGWTPPGEDLLLRAIQVELRQGYRYYAAQEALSGELKAGDAERRFVAGEIDSRIQETERRLLALVAVVADPRIARLSHHLRDASPQVTARVLELVDQSLDTRLSALVVPFLEQVPAGQRTAVGEADFDVPERLRADPVGALVELGDAHLRRCALLAFGERMAERFPELTSQEEPLLRLVERLRFLRSVPVFKNLAPEDLMKLAEIAAPVEHPARKVIFKKGDPGDVLCVVVRGRVEIRDQGQVIASQGPNDFFGELALFDQEPRSADAVCVEDTELLEIGGADLESLMERRPEIAREIIRVLAKRLRKTTQEMITRGK